MYARFLTFTSTPDKRKAIEAMTDKVYATASKLPGFVSAMYVASDDNTEYCSISLWKSQEEAQEAAKELGRQYGMLLADLANAEVGLKLMHVYEPKPVTS